MAVRRVARKRLKDRTRAVVCIILHGGTSHFTLFRAHILVATNTLFTFLAAPALLCDTVATDISIKGIILNFILHALVLNHAFINSISLASSPLVHLNVLPGPSTALITNNFTRPSHLAHVIVRLRQASC